VILVNFNEIRTQILLRPTTLVYTATRYSFNAVYLCSEGTRFESKPDYSLLQNLLTFSFHAVSTAETR